MDKLRIFLNSKIGWIMEVLITVTILFTSLFLPTAFVDMAVSVTIILMVVGVYAIYGFFFNKEKRTAYGFLLFNIFLSMMFANRLYIYDNLVHIDEGILDVDAYIKKGDETVYSKFLQDYSPDVIHIHTLMGLHKEFIHAANELGIRTVFTTHDYFGLCPKVTLFHNGKPCDNDHNCMDCVKCNQSALSLKKIVVLQSPVYRKLKNTRVVKLLRSRHRKNFFEETETETAASAENTNVAQNQNYEKLREYYVSMLKMIDFIHFNSSVTEMIYNRYFHPKNSAVISITHRDIKDHRKRKNFDHDVLRITYLGPAKPFKGFQFLIGVLDDIWRETPGKFELHIYTNTNVEREYITHKQEGYPYSQLEEIFDNTDLLIAPSQWYETFGFTVLEALSYGVPVMVTDSVGAKDIVCNISPELVLSGDKFGLKKLDLRSINRKIMNSETIIKTELAHEREILEVYEK